MKKKKQISYAITTIVLILIEVYIALYVHDAVVRPYIGDVLVVVVLYMLIRSILPERYPFLPLGIFMFAACVELMQLFHFVDRIGLGDNRFFRVLIGSVFDWKDIACYAIGCVLLGLYEIMVWRHCFSGEKRGNINEK